MKNDTVLIMVKVNVGPYGSKMGLHTQMKIKSEMTEEEVEQEIDQHVHAIRSLLREHFDLPKGN